MTKGNRLHEKAEKDGRQVAVFPYIGFIGFYAGPNVHIIDPVGLGDALIARLPQSGHWHVGHYFRNVPDGYIDTVKSGQNLIKDKHVAELYDEIKIMTVDPVFDKPRLKFLLRYWL
jgi:arabinofuranosyltransferase